MAGSDEWRLDAAHIAVPAAKRSERVADAALASVRDDEATWVVRPVGLERSVANTNQRPVYRSQSDAWAVATGRVFVRFSPGHAATARAATLRSCGFAHDEAVGYAPDAVWARPGAGKSAAAALAALAALRSAPGVVDAQPQLLMPSVARRR